LGPSARGKYVFIKIHLNVRTVSLHYLFCLPTNESVCQYPPVITAIHVLKKKTIKYEKIQRASILILENVNQSTFACSYIQQTEPSILLALLEMHTISPQNRNIYFLSELGQSILHFHNQVKVNLYMFANTTLDSL